MADPALEELDARQAYYESEQIAFRTVRAPTSGTGRDRLTPTGTGTPLASAPDESPRLGPIGSVTDPIGTTSANGAEAPALILGLQPGQLALLGIAAFAIWATLNE